MAEDAFREGLRGILEKEFGLRAERWSAVDEEGRVYGYHHQCRKPTLFRGGMNALKYSSLQYFFERVAHARKEDNCSKNL